MTLANKLCYLEEGLEGLPESAIEAFAGVGTPLSLGGLAAGETVLDVFSGAPGEAGES